jgi:hypothetical protein
MNVFLDLEETVIDSWHSGMLLNSAQVREWLHTRGVRQVHIFSFAVWHEDDRAHFDRNFRGMLTRALDVNIVACATVADFMTADQAITRTHWGTDLCEFVGTRGKVGAFTSWCELHHAGQHSVLLDDVVPNAVWTNTDTGTTLEFVNVARLLNQPNAARPQETMKTHEIVSQGQ